MLVKRWSEHRMGNRPHILLTVPHLSAKASPFREMMAIARYLPKEDYKLTICALRGVNEIEAISPELKAVGVSHVFLARYRFKGRGIMNVKRLFAEYSHINRYGPFDIQHSLDFTTSPMEAIVAKCSSRTYVYNQRDLALDHPTFV